MVVATNVNETVSLEAAWEPLVTAVALVDSGSRFRCANPAFCELFKVGWTRLRGVSLKEFGPAAQALLPLVQRVRKDERAIACRAQEMPMADGRIVGADVAASPWSDGGVLLELHRSMPVQQASPPARVSESLRGLAHEVKNPLAGVRGAAQLLKRRLTDPKLAHLADLIIGESDRLAALADRLLHAGVKSHLTSVNVHAVLERARALVVAEVEPTVRLERDYDPSLPLLSGDADRLQQLLLNLMRNAIQANAKSILLRTRAAHGALIGDQPARLALRVDVIDDGDGVPEELRDTLFLPLVSGRADGTGLGLALAQEIAQEHGGFLIYDGRRTGGAEGRTVFTLLLPLGADRG